MSAKTERPAVRTAAELERKLGRNIVEQKEAQQIIDGRITRVQNELTSFAIETVGDLNNVQKQLDGQIQTHYYNGVPTLLNDPAVNWSITEYPEHESDLYYDQNTGDVYRFVFDEEYKWQLLENQPLQEALSIANAAQDTADNKRRVFVTNPIPPYDSGDLWINNQELYICQISRDTGSYVSGDFILATKYTDDTVALSVQQAAAQLETRMLNVESTTDTLSLNFTKTITTDDITKQKLAEYLKYISFEDGNIILGDSSSNFKLVIRNNRIDIYYNNKYYSSWVEKDFTCGRINITQDIENSSAGMFAFIPRSNGSVSFRKVR